MSGAKDVHDAAPWDHMFEVGTLRGMGNNRMSSRTIRFAVRGVATDAVIMLLWRFGRHSWQASLKFGGVLLVLTVLATAYAWWWDRHPDTEKRMLDKSEAKRLRRLERHAREAEAAEAARRASGGLR